MNCWSGPVKGARGDSGIGRHAKAQGALRHGAEEGSPYTCQGVVLIPVLELCVKEPGIYFSSPFLAS